jgi:colicin import membrane protein
MREFLREHSGSVVVSVVLHGLLVAALILTAVISTHRKPPSLQPLPIDAVVVDSKIVHAAQRAQDEQAARARAADAAKAAAAAQEQRDAEAAAEQAKAAQEAKATEEAKAVDDAQAAKAAAAEKAADAAKEEQQQVADAQRAAAAHAAEAAKAAQARQAAEADLAAQAKRAAEAKAAAKAAEAKQAADAKHAADERARQDREAELRRQMADEEHRQAVESGPLRDSYIAKLRNRIQHAWIKPPSASVGLDCLVEVTQVPGGEVTGARVTQCNGDAVARQSIENAVYRASPLPDPPDPALFERNFVIRFKPDE